MWTLGDVLTVIHLANLVYPDLSLLLNQKLAPPSEDTTVKLRKVILSGLVNHVAM